MADVVCEPGESSFGVSGEEAGVCRILFHSERLVEDVEEGDKRGLVILLLEFVVEVCPLLGVCEEFEEIGV